MLAFWYKVANFFVVDSGGWRVLFGATVRAVMLGAAVSVGRSVTHGTDGAVTFDWRLFGITVGAVAVVNFLSNGFEVATRGGHLLRPIHGHVFRQERKAKSAAVLARISFLLRAESTAKNVAGVVTNILDCIALHVRDARGSHDKERTDVFVCLLVEDGEDMVVVARDSGQHSTRYRREIPARYPKASMLAGRALIAKRALGVGELVRDYPEGPTNKPYRSVLAIPVLREDGSALGVVSVDSTRPYFFESFKSGHVENELETGLLPYTQTLLLALDSLAGTEDRAALRTLLEATKKGS
jgi:hypothetical protein